MRSWLACLPVLAVLAGSAAADPVPCDRIKMLARFPGLKTLRAEFTDRKRIALLEEPLVSSGRIAYQRPDRIRQVTERPAHQTIVIAGSRVTVVQHDLGREESLDLGTNAVAKAVVGNILLVLGGRLDELSRQYRCTGTEEEDLVRLRLVPLKEPMSTVIREMDVVIAPDAKIRQVTLHEVGGDSSEMTFTNVVTDKPFTDEEVRANFTP